MFLKFLDGLFVLAFLSIPVCAWVLLVELR